MLIFDPTPAGINGYDSGRPEAPIFFKDGAGLLESLSHVETLAHCDHFAYVLHNGGDVILNPVTPLAEDFIIPFSIDPFGENLNRMTRQVFQDCRQLRPGARHTLLCETGFFSHLPAPTGAYALPQAFYRKGYRRLGGDGITHQWAWNQVKPLLPLRSPLGMVSVHLGDHPTLAAIRDGLALDSSLGFSDVEGLPSLTSSGSIDPAIVLLLAEKGMTPTGITALLERESGYSTLLPPAFAQINKMIADTSDSTRLARDIYFYKMVEMIGAFSAVLGGLDALVFAVDDGPEFHPFIRQICRHLAFMGIAVPEGALDSRPVVQVTQAGFWPHVFILHCRRAGILSAVISDTNDK